MLVNDEGEILGRNNFYELLRSHGLDPETPSDYLPENHQDNLSELVDFLRENKAFKWSRTIPNSSGQQLVFTSSFLSNKNCLISINEEPEINSQKFEATVKQSSHSIFITDLNGVIIFANPAVEELTGFNEDEIIGKDPRLFQSGLHDDEFYDDLYETIQAGEIWHGEMINQHKDEEFYVIDQTITPLKDTQDNTAGYVAINREITKRWGKREQMKEKHDPLMDIPIHEVLVESIQDYQIRHPDDQAVHLSIHLDNYETLEAVLGPQSMSLVTETVLDRIHAHTNPDDLLGKISRDVLILFSPKHNDDAATYAEKLLESLQKQFHYDGSTYDLNISIGYTVGVLSEKPVKTFMDESEKARLAAQENDDVNLQRYLTDHKSIRADEREAFELGQRIQKGIDRGEFLPHFQPIIDYDAGTLAGFETLARWDHEKRGILTPYHFIDKARDKNLLLEIEDKILNKSMDCLDRFNAKVEDKTFDHHVNFETKNFGGMSLVERLQQTVQSSSLQPENFHVEIVENSDLRAENAIKELNALRQAGFKLSIDDFGTGYSSLDYLVRIPADIVKIDKSLVQQISDTHPTNPVLFATLSMIRNLDKTIVVEGVETQFQHEKLVGLNAHYGQGYLYSKPMSCEETLDYINAYDPSDFI